MKPADYKRRNKRIYKERQAGATLRVLADKYGISHERARQIVIKEQRLIDRLNNRPVFSVNWLVGDDILSTRTTNCLSNAKVKSLAQLVEYSPKDLLAIRNFGPKSLRELQSFLREKGLSLKDSS